MKVTPWFEGKSAPDRIGLYDRRWPIGHVERHFWDGTLWRQSKSGLRFWAQQLPWRGLAQQPKGKK